MIDVMKRLAELDAANPNIVKEGVQPVEECGMMPEMGMMGMGHEHAPVPANLSLTASGASGEEVAGMLNTIMALAGVHKVGPQDLGIEAEPLVAEPSDKGPAPTAGDEMRSVIDKLNPGDNDDDNDGDVDSDEETDEGAAGSVPGVDSTPADPNHKPTVDANQYAHQENQPGQGDRMDGTAPKAFPTMEQLQSQLMVDYQKFLQETE